MWIYAVTILFLSSALCETEVKISTGYLKGQILKSRDGRPYHSFTSIPYAKPPIGELRFQAPEPADPWNGTLDATKSSNICVQKYKAESQEDCLYLNVYTPNTGGHLPVMFWLHGGGFSTGHGGPEMFGPDYFMDKNVVLVSTNYRLGVLGFLSTEDDVIPGNYGLKDQVMALRWVQNNIIKFGGDPGQVTIFGSSSSGACVGYHMLSPMSKGLFHKAILQSGSPLCRWSMSPPGLARNFSKTISNLAGCKESDTSEELLKCLKNQPTNFFHNVHRHFWEWRTDPPNVFTPVVEKCDSGHEAFLCHHQLFEFKQQSFVPAIIGLNSGEGGMIVASLYNETSLLYPELNTDFNRLASILLSYKYYTSNLDEIAKKLLKRYFPSGKIEDNSHLQTVQMITDGRYLHGIIDMALKLSSPVYFYLYDYQNEFSFNTVFGKCSKKLGITHADELTSLFKMKVLNPRKLNAMDTKVSKLMVNVWSKFASSKTPTIDGQDGSEWPVFDKQMQRILYVNSHQPNIIRNPFEERYGFWKNLSLLINLKN